MISQKELDELRRLATIHQTFTGYTVLKLIGEVERLNGLLPIEAPPGEIEERLDDLIERLGPITEPAPLSDELRGILFSDELVTEDGLTDDDIPF